MIKFEHDGLSYLVEEHDGKGCGVNTLRWNFKIEPFVAWWVVQMKEHTHKQQCNFM